MDIAKLSFSSYRLQNIFFFRVPSKQIDPHWFRCTVCTAVYRASAFYAFSSKSSCCLAASVCISILNEVFKLLMLRIGFIGAGGMAQALARGLIAGGLTPADKIICSCPRSDVVLLDQMRKLGCRTTSDNGHVADDSRILILAVKPPVIPKVLKDVSDFITPQHLIISVAMGITTRQIEKALPSKSRVVRVMPNTPALVREGASVFSCGRSTLEEDAGTAHRIFESVGICDQIEENLLDAVTGLSGSGPAYMFMAIEALADGGVKMGIRRELSLKLAAQTLLGSAKMVLETGKHPGALKDDVCSPAGTSIQAVHQLEKMGFRSALIFAVEAATLRSKETGGHS